MSTTFNIRFPLMPLAALLPNAAGAIYPDAAGCCNDGCTRFVGGVDEVAGPITIPFKYDSCVRFAPNLLAASPRQSIAPHMRGIYTSLEPDADTRSRLKASIAAAAKDLKLDALAMWKECQRDRHSRKEYAVVRLCFAARLCRCLGDVRGARKIERELWDFVGWQEKSPRLAISAREALSLPPDVSTDTFTRVLSIGYGLRHNFILMEARAGADIIPHLRRGEWDEVEEKIRGANSREWIVPRVVHMLRTMERIAPRRPSLDPDAFAIAMRIVEQSIDIDGIQSGLLLEDYWYSKESVYKDVLQWLADAGRLDGVYSVTKTIDAVYGAWFEEHRVEHRFDPLSTMPRLSDLYRSDALRRGRPVPMVHADGALPDGLNWQLKILRDIPGSLSGSEFPCTLSLDSVVPLHGIEEDREEYLEKIQAIASEMLLGLEVGGWRRGAMPSRRLMDEIMRERRYVRRSDGGSPWLLPLVTQGIVGGTRMMLNGHHRVAALVMLVEQRFLPKDVLHRIPFEVIQLDLKRALKPTIARYYRYEKAFCFSWADAMGFNASAAALMRDVGATRTLREAIDSLPWLKPRSRKG